MLDCMCSPFTKITYILTFLEQVFRAICGSVSWVAILILAQIKLNLQLFFKWTKVQKSMKSFTFFNENHMNLTVIQIR